MRIEVVKAVPVMKKRVLCVCMLLLAACSQGSDPSKAMMDYLQARVEANTDKMRRLSCADWESQALIQAESFRSMNAQLQNVSCSTGSKDGEYTVVKCDGRIVTTYNGEKREWELGSYRMKQEDGDWKMCGESR